MVLRNLAAAIILSLIDSFRLNRLLHYQKLFSVDEWLTTNGISGTEEVPKNTITVRFINNLSGKDIVTQAEEGTLLLAVGDNAGVKLPRACRTGLCGSCTCEMQDPLAVATATNPRDGYATVRACSYRCHLPAGMQEMVVDVHRMKTRAAATDIKKTKGVQTPVGTATTAIYTDPMARFSGDWEKEFRPQWELTKAKESKGMVGAAFDPKKLSLICSKCQGAGRVVCYACDGAGVTLMGSGRKEQCNTCVGRLTVGCGYCCGTGKKIK